MSYGDAHRLMLMQGVGIAMQRMHQSYKYMKAQQQKLSGCASNLLAHEDLGHLRRPIVGIYKPSSIMKNSHQYMKVTIQETLYHEDHGATSKHKCGKRIVTSSLLSFSLILFIFLFGPFLWPLFFLLFHLESQPDLWDNSLIMMIITLLFFLQLINYNSILRTKYDSI